MVLLYFHELSTDSKKVCLLLGYGCIELLVANLQIFQFQPVKLKNLERLYNWVVSYNLLILVI